MKQYGKYTILGWSWRILLLVALTPFLLLLLLSVLLYLPPVQKFAVDKACQVLSEEMEMEVTVDNVYLKFPLDLSMGGMLAVKEGDTIVDARELDVSIQAMPLFELKAEVDDVHLYDVKLNTKDLVEACVIKGRLAELGLDSHCTDVSKELAVVNKAIIRDADLVVLLADSVPEDTTESEPVTWKIQIDDMELDNVKAKVLLAPQADSTWVAANIGSAHASAFLDLAAETYRVDALNLTNSSASFDVMKQPHMKEQLDPNHMRFDDLTFAMDSFVYQGTTSKMSLNIKQLTAREQSGLHVKETVGRVEMDSVSLSIPRMTLTTDDSKVKLAYHMDMNAFDDVDPGVFSVVADAQIGKSDIDYFVKMGGAEVKDTRVMLNKYLPARSLELRVAAGGNLETLNIDSLHLHAPGLAVVDANATMWDVVGDLSLQAQADARFGKSSVVKIDGGYAMADESYNADIDLRNVLVNQFVPMSDRLMLSGKVSADGHGFDFFSPATALNATASLYNSSMGKINLSNIDADVTLKGGRVTVDMLCDNSQLKTDLLLDAELRKNLIAGNLNVNLPFLDAQAMGFSEERLQASTNGVFDFSYNLDKLFKLESHIDDLSLYLGNDSIMTESFDITAQALQDTTAAMIQTGDLYFDFVTPNNIFKLQPQFEKLAKIIAEQFKKRNVDLNQIKSYFPEAALRASAGQNNPVSAIMKTMGLSFREFQTTVDVSPVDGLKGKGHIYSFRSDSIMVDTAYFSVVQDSALLTYNAGLKCGDQPMLPAFSAYVDGYLKADEADAHVLFYDKNDKTGLDLGAHAHANDSCVNISLYPEKPIVAFRRFELNKDNYVKMRPEKPVLADVRLKSVSDSCYVELKAKEDDDMRQVVKALVKNLSIKDVLDMLPIPGLPEMAGLLNVDATYLDKGKSFYVTGKVDANNFEYEHMAVGNVGSAFSYTPLGTDAHAVGAQLSYNGTEVADVYGLYNSTGDGSLDADVSLTDIPMEMVSPFIPDQVVGLSGNLAGSICAMGPLDALVFNGMLTPKDIHVLSNSYSVDLALANDTIFIENSRIDFNKFNFYGADKNPLTLNGYVDFSNFEEIAMSLSLRGKEFKLIEAKRSKKKVLFGDMYADFFARAVGTTKDLTVRGIINVLPATNITYIMSETPLYQGDRLEDIVTFVDFDQPPPSEEQRVKKTYMGIDMRISLSIADGAKLNGEFSSDGQSYVNVQGGGNVSVGYTPEGVLNMQGRYTINEGEMKYTLPVIPLRTFKIHNGSYIEFTGAPANPTLNIKATERVKTSVGSSNATSRSVAFDVGLKISNTLENMGIEFIIDAPEDVNVQNELASASAEEKNKLAVAMLATGLYVASSNTRGITAGNALNSFLQNEINNIAGQALSTMVDVNVGMEQTTRDDGTKRTDYSFQFSRKFFSDRLNVVIGGKVSADGSKTNNESGAYIDDVSLEWRLDNGGTQYIRLFHEKDYTNLVEGEIDKNGAGVLLKKKVDKMSDLFIWRKKKEEESQPASRRNDAGVERRRSHEEGADDQQQSEEQGKEKNSEQ